MVSGKLTFEKRMYNKYEKNYEQLGKNKVKSLYFQVYLKYFVKQKT